MMTTYSLRLTPGQDLKRALDDLAREEKWSAACLVSGIGSLNTLAIRYANADSAEILDGPFEIISLAGTLSRDGSHLHILVSDSRGVAQGGHLKEGATIYTTAEIVIGILSEWDFSRKIDPATGSEELSVRRRDRSRNVTGEARPDR